MLVSPAGGVFDVCPNLNPAPAATTGGEATLDIQYITGVAQGVDTYFWSITPGAAAPDNAFLYEWAANVNAATDIPLLTSISYGLGESQYAQDGFGDTYISRTNIEFLKLCSRGSGILVAAGDAGYVPAAVPPAAIDDAA